MSDAPRPSPGDGPVRIVTHEAYTLNVTVNILPARDIPIGLKIGCRPRQGARREDKDPIALPEGTRTWLLGVNKQLSEWLAQDESHQHAFLADPVAALTKAGVKVEREHAKALARVRERIGTEAAVTPGLQLRTVRTKARSSGQVREVETDRSDWVPPKLRAGDKDCGCDHADEGGK